MSVGKLLLTGDAETYPKLCHIQCNVFVKRIKNDLRDPLVAPGSMNK